MYFFSLGQPETKREEREYKNEKNLKNIKNSSIDIKVKTQPIANMIMIGRTKQDSKETDVEPL